MHIHCTLYTYLAHIHIHIACTDTHIRHTQYTHTYIYPAHILTPLGSSPD